MAKTLSHLNDKNLPTMVDVGNKEITSRTAHAQSIVVLTPELVDLFKDKDINTKKGPVFQTAILAGIMACKQTPNLIPLCHPLALDKCNVEIKMIEDHSIQIDCTVATTGRTGVEMEALTGASIAALTIYDMCKAYSHDITIKATQLISKTGGKSDYGR